MSTAQERRTSFARRAESLLERKKMEKKDKSEAGGKITKGGAGEKMKKRQKVAYTGAEINLLVRCALVEKSVIENKKTDSATNRDKEEAWQRVADAVNAATSGPVRTVASLREKYNKLKQNLRKSIDASMKDAIQAGVSPPIKEIGQMTEALVELSSLLSLSIKGMEPLAGDDDKVSDHDNGYEEYDVPEEKYELSKSPLLTHKVIKDIKNNGMVVGDMETLAENNIYQVSYAGNPYGNNSIAIKAVEIDPLQSSSELATSAKMTSQIQTKSQGEMKIFSRERANPAKLRNRLNVLLRGSKRTGSNSTSTSTNADAKREMEIQILEIERQRQQESFEFERDQRKWENERQQQQQKHEQKQRALENQYLQIKIDSAKDLHSIRMRISKNQLESSLCRCRGLPNDIDDTASEKSHNSASVQRTTNRNKQKAFKH